MSHRPPHRLIIIVLAARAIMYARSTEHGAVAERLSYGASAVVLKVYYNFFFL